MSHNVFMIQHIFFNKATAWPFIWRIFENSRYYSWDTTTNRDAHAKRKAMGLSKDALFEQNLQYFLSLSSEASTKTKTSGLFSLSSIVAGWPLWPLSPIVTFTSRIVIRSRGAQPYVEKSMRMTTRDCIRRKTGQKEKFNFQKSLHHWNTNELISVAVFVARGNNI